MKEFIFKYGTQPSTWKGLTLVLGAVGVTVSPELVNAIGAVVASVIGAIEIYRDEHKE